MDKNFIITNGGTKEGDPLNLDFLTTVKWGGNFKTPSADQKKQVVFFYGVSGGATLSGSTSAFHFSSANLAYASYRRVKNYIKSLGIAEDLGVSPISITSITPNTAVAATPTPIAVVGVNFNDTGKITINGIDHAITFTDQQTIQFTTDAGLTAGTYDVEFTDPNGNAAVFASIIIT